MAYQIKVTLEDSKPLIWRRLLIPGTYSLGQLHVAIQVAMGWSDSHLFAFTHAKDPRRQIGWPFDEADDMEDADDILISDEMPKEGDKMLYEYDFGDGWMHTVLMEKIEGKDPETPICMAGKGACPPEDCGGIGGYYNLVGILNDPKHPEHKDMMEWMDMHPGEKWDMDHFDVDETNKALKMVFEEE